MTPEELQTEVQLLMDHAQQAQAQFESVIHHLEELLTKLKGEPPNAG